MNDLLRRSQSALWALIIVAFAASTAYAQGGGSTASLGGSVVDASGGVIPGASVSAKNNATGAVSSTVTDANGRFIIPALPPGTYTVDVTLTGFKTSSFPAIQILTATPATMKVTLQVGSVAETVTVKGSGTDVVQTRSATVTTTITAEQVRQLPLVTHTALDAVQMLTGVNTAASNSRGSTINGLPGNTINITLDGINVQDNRSHEGFFMYIRPMLDSIEEISVSTSTPGAEASGQGATQIRMTTRSGANRFSGSLYNTWRNQAGTSEDDAISRNNKSFFLWRLNSPYWFNKRDQPKTAAGEYFINDMRLQTPGFRVGGAAVRDKLFYFYNHEWFLWPNQINRTRTMLNTKAQMGLFTYPAVDGSGERTINLYQIAAANGQIATVDPTIGKLLAEMRTQAGTTGTIETLDQNLDRYLYIPGGTQKRHFPTVRLDANLTDAHRASFSYRYNMFNGVPDILNGAESRYPGFPNFGGQASQRFMWQTSLRSTFGKGVVNELTAGKSDSFGKGTGFNLNVTESMFNCTGIGCQSVNGEGFSIGFPLITGATTTAAPSASVAPLFNLEDTVTWLKGAHSLSFGGAYTHVGLRAWASTAAKSVTLGLAQQDTVAFGMLDRLSGNYPGGVTTAYQDTARSLYALLTGRVTAVAGTAFLGPDGTYKFNGERTNAVSADQFGFFVSDSWRAKPNLTITAGIRYELQLPMTTDGLYSRPESWQMVYGITGAGDGEFGQGNLYKPGLMTGVNPQIVPYENGSSAYNTDWNNFAPSFGVVWQPTVESGWLRKILSSEPVLRGGYSVSYTRLGVDFFDGNYSPNPGRSRAAGRTATTGTPVMGADGGWPVLLQQTNRLFPSAFPNTPTYPFAPANNETIDIHYPDWPVPLTHQYSLGFQRSLGRDTAIEMRYVGNTNVGGWETWNMNAHQQWSILENGYFDEFQKAQKNLRANIVAGRGNTFEYTGAAGTVPLPIFMAYFKGIPLGDPRNQDPAQYASGGSTNNFRTATWYNSLNMYNPSVQGMAGTGTSGLQNAAFAANAATAGLPANFFMANPFLLNGSAFLETTTGNTRYNALQFEMRRRLSSGFAANGSYQFMFDRLTSTRNSLREDWYYLKSGAGPLHAIKLNAIAQLPFGHGRRFANGVSKTMNHIIGGWEMDAVARFQSGARFNYGGFRLVGMTETELQDMFKFYHVADAAGKDRIYMLPQDVIEQSIIALTTTTATTATGYTGVLPTGRYLAPASGPDCVQYVVKQDMYCSGTSPTRFINGPWYGKVDMSFKKRIVMTSTMNIEATMDLFNIFDAINFNATNATGTTKTAWEVTSAATDVNAAQDPGGRITSFGLRFSW